MTAFLTITNPWAIWVLSYVLPLSPLAVVGVVALFKKGERTDG